MKAASNEAIWSYSSGFLFQSFGLRIVGSCKQSGDCNKLKMNASNQDISVDGRGGVVACLVVTRVDSWSAKTAPPSTNCNTAWASCSIISRITLPRGVKNPLPYGDALLASGSVGQRADPSCLFWPPLPLGNSYSDISAIHSSKHCHTIGPTICNLVSVGAFIVIIIFTATVLPLCRNTNKIINNNPNNTSTRTAVPCPNPWAVPPRVAIELFTALNNCPTRKSCSLRVKSWLS